MYLYFKYVQLAFCSLQLQLCITRAEIQHLSTPTAVAETMQIAASTAMQYEYVSTYFSFLYAYCRSMDSTLIFT
jgi:hypothetical protein